MILYSKYFIILYTNILDHIIYKPRENPYGYILNYTILYYTIPEYTKLPLAYTISCYSTQYRVQYFGHFEGQGIWSFQLLIFDPRSSDHTGAAGPQGRQAEHIACCERSWGAPREPNTAYLRNLCVCIYIYLHILCTYLSIYIGISLSLYISTCMP